MAPFSYRHSRSNRRRSTSLVAALTAIAVVGAPSVALAAPGHDQAIASSVRSASKSAAAPVRAPEPFQREAVPTEPTSQPKPAPVPAAPEPVPAAPLGDAGADATLGAASVPAANAGPALVTEEADPAAADPPPADPTADDAQATASAVTPAPTTAVAQAEAPAPTPDGRPDPNPAAPSTPGPDPAGPVNPGAALGDRSGPADGADLRAPAPSTPAAEAEPPVAESELTETPAQILPPDVSGSIEVQLATTVGAVRTPKGSQPVIAPPTEKPPAAGAPVDSDDDDAKESMDPASPPSLSKEVGDAQLTWVGGGGLPAVGVVDPAAPVETPPVSADEPIAAVATTGASASLIAPVRVPAAAAAAPVVALPSLEPRPDHLRPAASASRAAEASGPAIAAFAAPSPAVYVTLAAPTAAASSSSPSTPRVQRVRQAAGKVADLAQGARVATETAARSPWLPIGLLVIAFLYILGQRAMDRGSKLSYAGRVGDPDDELIEL